LLGASIALRFGLLRLISEDLPVYVRVLSSIAILIFGAVFVLTRSAELIEETTEVLSEKTKLAGGLLQSFGTAFPDMVLGVSAAFISLSLRSSDYERAINFAIIAAATTFGSNIYNIGHAAWCVWRQNLANTSSHLTLMFPHIKSGGHLTPMKDHRKKPLLAEFNTASLGISHCLNHFRRCLYGSLRQGIFSSSQNIRRSLPTLRPCGMGTFSIMSRYSFSFSQNRTTGYRHLGR